MVVQKIKPKLAKVIAFELNQLIELELLGSNIEFLARSGPAKSWAIQFIIIFSITP